MHINPRSKKSLLLVFIQLTCIAVIIYKGKVIPENTAEFLISALFLIVGAWAVLSMKFRFNIAPDLREDAVFVNSGPYRLIRHPMYLSVLGLTLLWSVSKISITVTATWFILLADIIFKINFEEKILMNTFQNFHSYTKNTKKLIPFLY